MGVLVHRSFPNEAANGVAITKNIYRPDNYGFILNVQLGEESVVKPKAGQVCDQLICYPTTADETYKYRNSMDIITISNLNNGQMVLSKAEIQNLADVLDIIKKVFYNKNKVIDPFLKYALDVEFKIDGANRDIYIKQVRRYND